MGMMVTVEIADAHASEADFDDVYAYFHAIDEKFSTYKDTSEISKLNRGVLAAHETSEEMQTVLRLCAETKKQTNGSFDIMRPDGTIDPSGLVKGWAIRNAAALIASKGFKNYFIDAGGDIQMSGVNAEGKPWKIGIRDPFNPTEKVVKVIATSDRGVATSGIYARGQHIYDPLDPDRPLTDIVSLTVIGPDVYEADRFATAAFAMGKRGIEMIEHLDGFEGYQIDRNGIATMTSGFQNYLYDEMDR